MKSSEVLTAVTVWADDKSHIMNMPDTIDSIWMNLSMTWIEQTSPGRTRVIYVNVQEQDSD